MALLFCDSFDAYAAKADITAKWSLGTNGSAWTAYGSFSASGGKFGGGSINIAGTSGNSNAQILAAPVSYTYSAGYTLCVAAYVKFGATPSGSTGFLSLLPTSATVGTLGLNSSGQLIFYPLGTGSPNATSGTRNLADNAWHWIEAKIVLNTATAGSVTAYVDGTLELSIPSVATISSGTPNGFALGTLSFQNTYFDDVIVWDTSGAAFNTFPLGPRRIACLNPNAAGASTQFTPSAGANYSCVSQAYSGAAYVADAATGNTDLYGTAGLTYTPASVINAVMVNVYAINPAGDGTKSIIPKLRSGATPSIASGTSRTLSGMLANYQSPFYQDASATNWTATTVNAAQPGIGD